MPGREISELLDLARDLRIEVLEMLQQAGSGHPGGSLSCLDLLSALFFRAMRGWVWGQLPTHQSDRFVLSKGHAVPALYVILNRWGLLAPGELATLRRLGSRLQGHPDRVRLPAVEASTGSLGQGLSVAQGLALGLRAQASQARVYCLLGDGEIQEGQIWEAAMSAPKFKLGSLVAILDHNGAQIDGPTAEIMPLEPLAQKWRAFGWRVTEIDGHDMHGIVQTLEQTCNGGDQPHFILAHTIKGKGVSFMEHQGAWHGSVPGVAETAQAITELRARKPSAHVARVGSEGR